MQKIGNVETGAKNILSLQKSNIVKTKHVNSYNCPLPPLARYYNSSLSIWISVDPMSDRYPNLSPYTYCAGNPVRLVDEDGRDYEVVVDNNSEHPSITIRAVYYTSKEYGEKLQEAVDYWNEQKFALVTHENGERRQVTYFGDGNVGECHNSVYEKYHGKIIRKK